ncbi:SGNH/GDSL hydrolase family protein [Candidatus Margulisiibacteriota bacterium]
MSDLKLLNNTKATQADVVLSTKKITNHKAFNGHTVGVFGDSITADIQYVNYIRELKKLCPSMSFENHGISNQKTWEIKERLKTALETKKYDQIIILCGVNNVYNPDKVIEDLKEMYAMAKAHGARVIAVTLTPNQGWEGFAKKQDVFLKNTQKVNDFILGRNGFDSPKNVDVAVNVYDKLGSQSDPHKMSAEYTNDFLHPCCCGQTIIAQEIFKKAFFYKPKPPVPLFIEDDNRMVTAKEVSGS